MSAPTPGPTFKTRAELVAWAEQRVKGMNASSRQEQSDVLADIRRVTEAHPQLFSQETPNA